MKQYLPNKSEIAMLVFGFGLGVVMVVTTDRIWTIGIVFAWPIFFIAMPLVYIIGKRKDNLNKNTQTSKISEKESKSIKKV